MSKDSYEVACLEEVILLNLVDSRLRLDFFLLIRSIWLTKETNRIDRTKFGLSLSRTELMTEFLGLDLFGLGLFLPTPNLGCPYLSMRG